MACLSPASFDIFLFEVFGPLLVGGTCVLFPHQPSLDPRSVAAALPALTCLHAVPAVMRELIREVRAGGVVCRGLGTVFVGGDAVAPELLDEMLAAFPESAIRILYGPTEASIICASHAVAGRRESRRLFGGALPGVVLRVLDRGGEPAAIGIVGELCIGGAGLADGYFRASGSDRGALASQWVRR